MLILHNSCNDWENNGISIAAIFGVGLIGAHLTQNLIKRQYSVIHELPFSWQNPQQRKKEKADILDYIQNLIKNANHDDGPCRGGVYPCPDQNNGQCRGGVYPCPDQNNGQCRGGVYPRPDRAGINPAPTKRGGNNRTIVEDPESYPPETTNRKSGCCKIDFVWSAGKGGFSMEASDTIAELEAFSEVVELAIAVKRKTPSCTMRFHMVSSAGGLFEGQRNVNADSPPDPQRPYGFLKLAQEKILEDCDELVRLIYRPTSVYGFAGLNRRLGLIPTLLWNGARNKVCTIFGAPETLRDYVWANDIGAFIADRVNSDATDSARYTLASGKPSALFEVLNHTEKILNKKLFRHYIKSGGNAEHNTFSLRMLPKDWKPSALKVGILKTFYTMFLIFN